MLLTAELALQFFVSLLSSQQLESNKCIRSICKFISLSNPIYSFQRNQELSRTWEEVVVSDENQEKLLGWRDGSMDESAGCSSKRLASISQHPHGSSQLFVTPAAEEATPSHRHTRRQNTNTHKIKINPLRKRGTLVTERGTQRSASWQSV